MRLLSTIGRFLFGFFFIVSGLIRLNEFDMNKEVIGNEYVTKMSRPLNLLVRPHMSTKHRMAIVGVFTFGIFVYKAFGGCLLIFNHIEQSIIPLGIYLLLEIPIFCGFYHYKVIEPEFMFLFQDFVQNVSLFGAFLFFMDMNLIKTKQDVLARKEKRFIEMNKRVYGETLNIVVVYSQESIMSQPNIMKEILSWLPVKSLLRFKCVSKSWDITWDPYFRMNHQSRHEVNSQRFLLLREEFDMYTQDFDELYSTSSLTSLDDVQRIDYLSSLRHDPSIDILCGSCDGLILIQVSTNPDYLSLWNPSTRESIQLPFPIFRISNSTFGLGYDPTIDDYKILTISHEKLQTQCGILALRSGSWRNNVDMKTPHTLKERFNFRDTLSFVHGAFHWIPCCFGVASFNISNEVCTEIPLSEQMYSYLSLSTTENNHVSVLDGMLCFSSTCNVDHGDQTFMLWAMKDYGVKESWTQIFKINISNIWFVKSIYRFADGDVLFHCRDYEHDLLSTSKGQFSHPLIQDEDKVEIITFNESLISPKLLI